MVLICTARHLETFAQAALHSAWLPAAWYEAAGLPSNVVPAYQPTNTHVLTRLRLTAGDCVEILAFSLQPPAQLAYAPVPA